MNKKQGMGMVEVIIASAVMSIVLVSIISVYSSLAELSLKNTEVVQANFLLEEGAEILRIMRDDGWQNIESTTVNTQYRFLWNNTTWVATTSLVLVDQFDRTVVLQNVNRDTNFNIVSTGGILDPGTRKANISVSWNRKNATTTKMIETYVFNTLNN